MSDVREWDFTFTWRIEGFSRWKPKQEIWITSPEFTIEAFGNSNWYFEIDSDFEVKKEDISCTLCACETQSRFVLYKIEIMTGNGETLITCTKKETFGLCTIHSLRNFITRDELFEKMENCRSEILIVQCSVSGREDGAMPLAKKDEAWMTLSSDRSCIEWGLKSFENLHSAIGRRCFYLGDMLYEMEAKAHQEDVISIRRLWKTSSDVVVDVNGKMIILDAQGNAKFSLEGGNLFNPNDGPENYDSFFHKKGLNKIVKERTNKMMKGMEIIFRFEFHLQCETIIGSKAKTVSDCFGSICSSIGSILNVIDDFRNLLSSENLSDVKLKADNNVMKAHRSILAARSPVFFAMFNSDMLENKTGIVDIEDVDENALASFLRFLYTGMVDDLDFEKASKLLLVAEKYQVPSLKEKCCHFLISNLRPENVISVLALADMVQRETLKNTCLEFITAHITDVFKSPSWLQMIKENVKLASEVSLYIGQQCAKT